MIGRRTLVAGLAAMPLLPPAAASGHRDMVRTIGDVLARAGIPGAGLAIVDGRRVHAFGIGWADLAARRPLPRLSFSEITVVRYFEELVLIGDDRRRSRRRRWYVGPGGGRPGADRSTGS